MTTFVLERATNSLVRLAAVTCLPADGVAVGAGVFPSPLRSNARPKLEGSVTGLLSPESNGRISTEWQDLRDVGLRGKFEPDIVAGLLAQIPTMLENFMK